LPFDLGPLFPILDGGANFQRRGFSWVSWYLGIETARLTDRAWFLANLSSHLSGRQIRKDGSLFSSGMAGSDLLAFLVE
jgi:hypothetical protein